MQTPVNPFETIPDKDELGTSNVAELRSWAPKRTLASERTWRDAAVSVPPTSLNATLTSSLNSSMVTSVTTSLNTTAKLTGGVATSSVTTQATKVYTHNIANFDRSPVVYEAVAEEIVDVEPSLPGVPRWMVVVAIAAVAALVGVLLGGALHL